MAAVDEMRERIFQEIVVEYPPYNFQGKPYFSIKYIECGQEFIGFGTYKPEVLSEYLKEYFMPSVQPEVVRCKDCKHRYGKACDFADFWLKDDDYCSRGERRTDDN